MKTKTDLDHLSEPRIRALADFRFNLRKFLHFSEDAATQAGLTPQQHQLLLQIAGAPEGTVTAVGYLAERLVLRHHSVVELSNRCEEAGLIVRRRDPLDRRQVVLKLTATGQRVLAKLSADHARELNELGPQLIAALEACTAQRPAAGMGDAVAMAE
jgi:DNA-binding MarR family transcriptional regulator